MHVCSNHHLIDVRSYLSTSFSLLTNSLTTVNIASRVSFVVADGIIIAATIYYTYGTAKTSREANIQSTFSSTLLRAG